MAAKYWAAVFDEQSALSSISRRALARWPREVSLDSPQPQAIIAVRHRVLPRRRVHFVVHHHAGCRRKSNRILQGSLYVDAVGANISCFVSHTAEPRDRSSLYISRADQASSDTDQLDIGTYSLG